MSEATSQLQHELERSLVEPLVRRRPVLSHLNADTSWLLSLPYPPGSPKSSWRSRFNILIDPWLQGPQSDYVAWFSTQWHKIDSRFQTIDEINVFLKERELGELDGIPQPPDISEENSGNYIDLVICSHEFTDHCHKATLGEIDPSVPCFATTRAAKLIRSWNHFAEVIEVPPFSKGSDWKKTCLPPLPSSVGIARLVTKSDALYFHSAIAVFHQDTSNADGHAEAIIYTPHGIDAEDLVSIPAADPPISTLALMHGLHDVSISLSKQLNLGARNAIKCQRILKSKYWVGTHDEVKPMRGIIAPFLRRKAYTLQDVFSEETEDVTGEKPSVIYTELESGQTLVLT